MAKFLNTTKFGGGAIALICAILITFFVAGCNGHSNPVVSNDSGDATRIAQVFDSPTTWTPVGRALDSATSMWTHPRPDGITPDDIAVYDDDIDAEIGVTAVVKRDEDDTPSKIYLTLIDFGGTAHPIGNGFYNESLNSTAVCRHPSVEITYSRDNNCREHYLRVHVVWSQEDNPDDGQDWELCYRLLEFQIDENHVIDWNPVTDSTVILPFCNASIHEEEPDLCIDPTLDNLIVVYLSTNTGTPDTYKIMEAWHDHSYMHEYPGTWSAARQVSDADYDSDIKLGPTVDAGHFDGQGAYYSLYTGVAAVWTQETEDFYTAYQVWYNDWTSEGSPNDDAAQQMTYCGEFAQVHHALPKIDIPSTSAGTDSQAVIAFMRVTQVDQAYSDWEIIMTATPDLDGYHYLDDTDYQGSNRVPDIACYQTTQGNDQYVGISYYHQIEGGAWRVRTQAYKYEIDSGESSFTKQTNWNYEMPSSNGWWGGFAIDPSIFTGSTLCLRIPNTNPVYSSTFGLGWIDTSSCYVKLTQGTIYYQ